MKTFKGSKKRTAEDRSSLRKAVAEIIERVTEEGDKALRDYNRIFDGCERENLRITEDEIRKAYDKVALSETEDMRKAAANIRAFAEAQRDTIRELKDFSPSEGITLGHRVIPVGSCCCYVPGGGYPLYSTAMMLGIPAGAAGVGRIAACSPVMKGTDEINPRTLVAMI